MEVLHPFDPQITREKAVFLQINGSWEEQIIPYVWIIAESLQYIWAKRQAKSQIRMIDMK